MDGRSHKRGETQEELDQLFNLSLDLLCVAGTDGYFKQINPAFERVLGYEAEELLRCSFLEFVHPDDRADTLAAIDQLSRGLPVVDFQNRYLAKDGQYRWLAWRSAPVPEQGLIYAVARDITEQKRIHETLERQALELKRSNADLEQFAYAASHDLQAPLRAIRNVSEWIEEDLPEELPETVRDHLTKLRSQVDRMEKLVDDLLRFARAGVESVEASKVDVTALIQDLVELLAPPEGLRISCEPDLPLFETARPPLEQVFRNLIGNAITHHDRDRGRIVIAARDRGRHYEFSVTDDGPGIAEASREAVFKMFTQLCSRTAASGTGIGLALVKKIVQSYGGDVSICSPGERGTTFAFTWPKRITRAEKKHADDPGS
jgi:PAS domain S-box-containing protein